ncbi:MAG: EF-P lysine aminoacylase EpmA [Victivallaceae bacterium]
MPTVSAKLQYKRCCASGAVKSVPESVAVLDSIKARLVQRAGLIASIRNYFDSHGFLEIETPVLIKSPAPEEFIESITANYGFLRTSPELQMKPLLSTGYDKIYQIGACFREGEFGRRHRPEFTMLEWYQAAADYMTLLKFTTEFIKHAAMKLFGNGKITYQGSVINLEVEPELITVNEAFLKYTGITAAEAMKQDVFDELMVTEIEPELGRERLTFLLDYPAERASLARLKKTDQTVAERWELYIAGLELANAYSELTDPLEQKRRFDMTVEYREANGMRRYPEPTEFFAALNYGLPECAGCALGIDRLVMIFTDASDIADVKVPLS